MKGYLAAVGREWGTKARDGDVETGGETGSVTEGGGKPESRTSFDASLPLPPPPSPLPPGYRDNEENNN